MRLITGGREVSMVKFSRSIATMAFLSAVFVQVSHAQEPIGAYLIWQDFEGGKTCTIELGTDESIGGKQLSADEDCLTEIDFGEAPIAWHIDDEGWIRFTDALRKLILRFEPRSDGSFYARRVELQKESLVLSPAD